ncbi:EcsC family protein [Fredinandcohnia quinoae]|uniref:EcsC family protein n=1 Tax=Fredinandcohnia quinoae TaxID=2918902 RepID=A0AAW5EAA0_9BACI|nr:EcsC family protein [Fredinandcohnia sp. SECRCQ15]MCH1626812.1 EcsC family protein [Fredinandcohnia sp. SECRCQ15]
MDQYNQVVKEELFQWRKKLIKKSTILNRVSKKAQVKINELIPEKAHQIITESIKKMIQATLIGSEYTTKVKDNGTISLEEKEKRITEILNIYKRTAAVEGAGTGAGGFMLALADFPLLLTIKMKFLFETASIYGFDTKEYEERLFILHVFQLAFSSDEHRKETFEIIENWDMKKEELMDVDWRVFQQEYRDYIDFVKMLQLVPGIGAVVGAYANYNLLDHLGETAKNCYRLRLLNVRKAK